MRRNLLALVGWLLAWPASAQEPAREIPLALRVNHAIALGVDYLKSLQRGDGSFAEFEPNHPGGATALAAYTLVKSGVKRGDAELQRALRALHGVAFRSTYSAAVHLLLCEALRDPAWVEAARASLEFLLDSQQEESGVWAYPWGQADSSNTQFALLGLRAAARMGLLVPEKALVAAAEGLAAFDHPKGGFSYGAGQGITYAGITAAGLAGFAVLDEFARDSARLRAVLERRAKVRAQAEEWMETRFDPLRNQHGDGTWRTWAHYAYLWAVERWCGLAGRERIGKQDWYTEGATWLVATQGLDGSFGSARRIEDVCFALLFLRRATVSASSELAEIYAEIDRARFAGPGRHAFAGAGALRLVDWWIAGPWPQSGEGPILLDPPFTPADVDPRARGKIARREWEPCTLRSDQWTDLEVLTDRVGDRLLWLACTRLTVAGRAPLEALLWLELEEGWDVWLDRERLSRERRRAMGIAADVSIPLRLTPGTHTLAVLVEDRRSDDQRPESPSVFGALLTGLDNGPPPAGLEVERHERSKPRPR